MAYAKHGRTALLAIALAVAGCSTPSGAIMHFDAGQSPESINASDSPVRPSSRHNTLSHRDFRNTDGAVQTPLAANVTEKTVAEKAAAARAAARILASGEATGQTSSPRISNQKLPGSSDVTHRNVLANREARTSDNHSEREVPPSEKLQLTVYQPTIESETDDPNSATSLFLTLDNAIALSLDRNPDLIALRAGEQVASTAINVAQTYPWNPQFQMQVLPYTRDRNGNDAPVSQQYVVVQTFETGGQQQYRIGAASANQAQVSSTIRQAELLNAAQTARLFFASLYQRELRNVNRSLADLNDQLADVMQRREKAGQANYADVELARLQAQTSRRQQRLAEASYDAAVANLRNQLNLDGNVGLELPENWLDWQWRSWDEALVSATGSETRGLEQTGLQLPVENDELPLEIDDVTLRQLVSDRPDIAAARAAATMAAENLQLANAMRRPDLQIGPMWQRDNTATQYWGVQAQMDLPVVNNGKPLVAQRVAELQQQQIAAQQLENRAVLEARAAIERYERARRLVEQSRGEFDREMSHALQSFDDLYLKGQITLLQVFAARTAFTQSRQSFLDLLNELALAGAELTQATGLPPQEFLEMTRGPLE